MINEIMSKIMQKRIPQIEYYMTHPEEVQANLFKDLICSAKDTVWGQYYEYRSIKSWKEFSERVPVNDYD